MAGRRRARRRRGSGSRDRAGSSSRPASGGAGSTIRVQARQPEPEARGEARDTRMTRIASERRERPEPRSPGGGRHAVDPGEHAGPQVRRLGCLDPGQHARRRSGVAGHAASRGQRDEELLHGGVDRHRVARAGAGHGTASRVTPAASSGSRIRRSARWSRDLAVPGGIPSAPHVSDSDRPRR